MRNLYIDCGMGAAGDMLTAALLELLDETERMDFVAKLNNIGIEKVKFSAERSMKCGIVGTHVSVIVDGVEEDDHMHDHNHHHDNDNQHDHNHHHDNDNQHNHNQHHDNDNQHDYNHHHDNDDQHDHSPHGHEHHHSSMHDIEHIVRDHLNVSDKVKDDVIAVYNIIAEAESKVHNKPIENIHFHEVGTMDAVADITAVCLLMEHLNPDKVIVSPVHVGSGQVKCAHGILPVPAPATALILNGIPIYSGNIKGELCTPTGAALLKHFASDFASMPIMRVSKIGYGMGKKDFDVANCVRVMLSEDDARSTVTELSFNVDDMTGESIGFLMDKLLSDGALEVFSIPVGMKKSRPGVMICALCNESDKDKMVQMIFKYSTTLGIRENVYDRYTLGRRIETIDTMYGPVRKKISEGYGIKREKLEYEDLKAIAQEMNLSIDEVRKSIEE